MKRPRSRVTRSIFAAVVLSVLSIALMNLTATRQSAAPAMTTFTVNSTLDLPDLNPGDGLCNTNVATCTLRAAIMEANASTGPNTIMLPAGTYTLTRGPADDEFNFNGADDANGDLDILNNNLTIIGAGANSTIIDGGGIDRVIDINNFSNFGTAINVTLQGLTVRNGNAHTSPEGFREAGGGIQFDGTDNNTGLPTGTLTITNCRIFSNTAAGVGGGVLITFGSLIMTGSEVSGNTSTNASGGGILYDGGSPSGLRNLQITNSTISGNQTPNATFGNGAGLWAGGNATKTVNYNVITNNSAGANGGGVFNGNGSLTLNFNVIVDNTATNAAGTGFQNNTGTITIDNDWWGCNQGPSSSPCDRAAGVGVTKWLTLHHTASPNPILINQSTTLQADFFTNNLGSAIAVSDLVALNGRAVTFNNPVLGTISGAGTQISSGKANATFNAGSTGGNGSADATVDHATVTAPIEIDQPATVATNPSDTTVCDGATATFTASANGFPTPTVQWQVSTNGGGSFTNIPGATSTTLSFTATASQNGNQYRAVFTNSSGTQTTTAATLTVNTAPTVTTNPTNQTVCDGQTATFTAAANGSPAPTVQWQVSTGGPFSNIPGATSTTLSFSATLAQNGNSYRAVFTNSCGTATTTAATLTVNANTSATDLVDQTVCQGATANFSTTASGTSLHYSWTVDGSSFGGDTSSISVPTGSVGVGNHSVSVTVSGACGTVVKNATLTVNANTTATDLVNQTVCQGATASFSTTASGTAIHYSWTVDGSPFDGDNASISVPTNSLSVGNHSVSVTVSGTCGNVTKNATLTVQANTSATDLVNQTVCQGATASFSTTAGGTGPFHYAWTLDGSPFNGDSAGINVPTGSLSVGNHSVSVVVSGTCGSVTKNATLTVQANTSTTKPNDQTVCEGTTASFSTTASGTGPFTFVWKKGATVLHNGDLGGRVTITNGSTTSTLTISGTLASDAGTYSVETTGTCGTAVQSANLAVDNSPPVITLNGNVITLSPPNHAYHTINVTDLVASASSCDGTVNVNTVIIDHVTSDELNGDNDMVIGCNRKSAQLRADRDGGGDGRVYTIYFKATDSHGHSTIVSATVTVPHNQNSQAVDSGPHSTVTNATCP